MIITNYEANAEKIHSRAEELYRTITDIPGANFNYETSLVLAIIEISGIDEQLLSSRNKADVAIAWLAQEAKDCKNCYWKDEERACSAETKERCKANNYEYWEDENKNPEIKKEEGGETMPDYKQRMLKEYQELKEKYMKLHKMTVKYEAGTLDFTPDCPIALLKRQKAAMGEYLNVLEIRAEIEGVDLGITAE